MRLVRIQRGVNAAEHDPGAAFARDAADLVAAQRVAGVDADADDVAGLDRCGIEHFQRFVRNERDRRTVRGVAAARTYKPTGRDDTDAERQMAGIDQVHVQVEGLLWPKSRSCRVSLCKKAACAYNTSPDTGKATILSCNLPGTRLWATIRLSVTEEIAGRGL